MCGLVGIAGDLEFKDEATMKRMFILDYFRGPDSTGFASVRGKNNEVLLTKIASHPIDLFDTRAFVKALSGNLSHAFIGHNRAATVGKVNGVNAHPFHVGKIVGAHNGTLDLPSWKRLNEALGEETDVDSYAIFACIDKIGIEETIKLMETGNTSQRGAWALVWVNTEENTLNFLRNKHRPLWYCYNKKFSKIFWASEHEMIEAATEMSTTGYDLHSTKDGYRFFQFAEDWLYTYDLDELVKGSNKRPNKVMKKKLEGREAPVFEVHSSKGHHNAPFQSGGNHGTNSTMTSLGTSPSHNDNSGSGHEIIDLVGTEEEPLGGYMPRSEFEVLAKYGCSWCSADVSYDDVGVVIIEAEDAILCPSCSGLNEGQTRVYADSYNHHQFSKSLLN